MFRTCMLQLCGLAVSISSATVAVGQYQTTGSQSTSLNQMALKNAQAILLNSLKPSSPMTGAGRIGLGVGDSLSGSKPFSSYSPGPTISPYLNLFRVDAGGNSNFNYSTLVEPELRQQQLNQQQQRQNQQISRRLQAIAAQSDYNPQGAKDEYPTGHQTVFMYYGHYYPVARPHPKKR